MRRYVLVGAGLLLGLLVIRETVSNPHRVVERLHLAIDIQPEQAGHSSRQASDDEGQVGTPRTLPPIISKPFRTSGNAITATFEQNAPSGTTEPLADAQAILTLISEDTGHVWRAPRVIQNTAPTNLPWFSSDDVMTPPEGWYRARLDVVTPGHPSATTGVLHVREVFPDRGFTVALVLILLPLLWVALAPRIGAWWQSAGTHATNAKRFDDAGFEGAPPLHVVSSAKEPQ